MNPKYVENLELIRQNLQEVKERMRAASEQRRCSEAATPKLLAVTKYAQPAWIEALYQLGERNFGENRPQQLASRYLQYSLGNGWKDANWHLIGQLQRNKVKSVLGKTEWIHSVNSLRLLKRIDQSCTELQTPVRVLLQINISGEQSKQGFQPEEILENSSQLSPSAYLSICGLMTMAPQGCEEKAIRPVFRGLRELRDQLQQRVSDQIQLQELSMGMSSDYEIAIQEGATIVRIGSRLFQSCT